MDIEDFLYNYKYKLIVPAIYIATWALMFVGPFFIPVLYQKICISLILYLTAKSLILLAISIIAYFKNRRILKRAEQLQNDKIFAGGELPAISDQVYHAFIIPSYK